MRAARPMPLHPLLFAAFPVLFLFAQNVAETPTRDVLGPLGLAIAGAAGVLAVLTIIMRDLARAALPASALILAFFSYGHVRAAMSGSGLAGVMTGREAWLLGGWLALSVAVVWLGVRIRRGVPETTRILNVAAVALVSVSLIPAAQHLATARGAPRAQAQALPDGAPVADAPDIYYLIFDRYGSQETLQRVFGIDNAPFLDRLEASGFDVIRSSRSNYPKTAHSLAASLNMTYLDDLAERHGSNSSDWLPVYGMLQDHAVGRFLHERGYDYVHIGSWWDPTGTNHIADVNPRFDERSDFHATLYATTLASAVADQFAGEPDDPGRRRHYDIVDFQLSQLRAASRRPGPTFVFAHVLLPHEPYVFDADGGYVTAAQERSQPREAAFAAQLSHTNALIEQVVADLLSGGDRSEPVIILQADEGPHPLAYERGDQDAWNWEAAATEDLEEKFQILNAFHLPGGGDTGLYEGISPVNSFRLVFNRYFGADLPLLPDEQHVFRDNAHPLRFTDVTDRLGGG